MNEEQLKYIDKLAHVNLVIFQHMAGGQYGSYDEEPNNQARNAYLRNFKEIKKLLGVGTYQTDSLVSHIELLKGVEDNKQTVEELNEVIKAQLEDIQYPKVNRVYKINLEAESKFDVIEEIVEDPKQAIYREPIGMEPYTREQWLEVIEGGSVLQRYNLGCKDETVILDEDIISAAKNFMLGPCGAWRNKALLAETRTFGSLEELKENILKESQEKDMVLYKVYTFEKVEIDWNVGPPKTLEEIQNRPKTIQYAWRGAFVDKLTERGSTPLTEQEAAVFAKYGIA
jgi:hypothetical protein